MRSFLVGVFGLVFLGGIAIAALVLRAEEIQYDVGKRTQKAVAALGADWAEITVDGRNVRISGVAPSDDAKAAVVQTARAVDGVRAVGGRIRVDAVISPYVWRLDNDAGEIVLSGHVPDANSRRYLHDLAQRSFGRPVSDRTRIGRGKPEGDWLTAASFAVRQLAKLGGREAVLHDTVLTVSGREERLGEDSDEIFAAAAEEALLSPFEAKLEIFQPEPEVAEAAPAAEGSAEEVPAEDMAAEESLVEPAAGPEQESLADGTTADKAKALADDSGSEETAAVEKPVAPTQVAATQLATFVGASAASSADQKLRIAECQQRVEDLMSDRGIVFPSGKRKPTKESRELIKDLAEALFPCRDLDMEVAGHTDSAGKAKANQRLSEIRARAVAAALAEAGLPAERLKAIGYGPSRPIADNDTEAGRAQNRRIEITVRQAVLAEN